MKYCQSAAQMFGVLPFCEGCLLILRDLGSLFFFSKIEIGQCKVCPVNRTVDRNDLVGWNLLKHRKSSWIILFTAQCSRMVDSQELTERFGTHVVQKLVNLLDIKVRVTIQSGGQVIDFSKKLSLPQKINRQRTNTNQSKSTPVYNLPDGSLKIEGRNQGPHQKTSQNHNGEIDNSDGTMMFFHNALLFIFFDNCNIKGIFCQLIENNSP